MNGQEPPWLALRQSVATRIFQQIARVEGYLNFCGDLSPWDCQLLKCVLAYARLYRMDRAVIIEARQKARGEVLPLHV